MLVNKAYEGIIASKYAPKKDQLSCKSVIKKFKKLKSFYGGYPRDRLILWPEKVIIAAFLEVDARFMRGLTNEQLLICFITQDTWDPYWFSNFWIEIEGDSETTYSAFLKCCVELVRDDLRLKLCLLTLRGLVS
jgi:hypothetical protein